MHWSLQTSEKECVHGGTFTDFIKAPPNPQISFPPSFF